jgi:hypothetical protein
VSRNKNVSKEPAETSSKLKLILKKEGSDSTKFLVIFIFFGLVLYVEYDVMNFDFCFRYCLVHDSEYFEITIAGTAGRR